MKTITLACIVTGNPQPKLEWYKDGNLFFGGSGQLIKNLGKTRHESSNENKTQKL